MYPVQSENTNTAATIPHTEPNVAVADVRIDLVQLGNVAMYPFGNIVRGPQTNFFDAYSFYFGCGENTEEGIVSVAV